MVVHLLSIFFFSNLPYLADSLSNGSVIINSGVWSPCVNTETLKLQCFNNSIINVIKGKAVGNTSCSGVPISNHMDAELINITEMLWVNCNVNITCSFTSCDLYSDACQYFKSHQIIIHYTCLPVEHLVDMAVPQNSRKQASPESPLYLTTPGYLHPNYYGQCIDSEVQLVWSDKPTHVNITILSLITDEWNTDKDNKKCCGYDFIEFIVWSTDNKNNYRFRRCAAEIQELITLYYVDMLAIRFHADAINSYMGGLLQIEYDGNSFMISTGQLKEHNCEEIQFFDFPSTSEKACYSPWELAIPPQDVMQYRLNHMETTSIPSEEIKSSPYPPAWPSESVDSGVSTDLIPSTYVNGDHLMTRKVHVASTVHSIEHTDKAITWAVAIGSTVAIIIVGVIITILVYQKTGFRCRSNSQNIESRSRLADQWSLSQPEHLNGESIATNLSYRSSRVDNSQETHSTSVENEDQRRPLQPLILSPEERFGGDNS